MATGGTGLGSSRCARRSAATTSVVDKPPELLERLRELCRVLADHVVDYVLFGSMAAVLRGVALATEDADLVPGSGPENLQRLCDALNTLSPRWRVEGFPDGLKIDGRVLEPRHFMGGSVAVGLVTSLGPIDVVLAPAGFEDGFAALTPHATEYDLGGSRVLVGSLDDLIRSKEILGRAKDAEHLRLLRDRRDDQDNGAE
jgi:hypothetical protein